MIKVIYKGKDVTDDVSINRCWHDMYSEGQTDTLHIRFNDDEHVWDSWGVQTNDEISVEYGAIKTGKMFVQTAQPTNGLFEIVATAAPSSYKDKKSKAWQKIKLKTIGKEIAAHHGLEFEAYGVEDVLYDYILQKNESDFAFLHKRCCLEGCAFLVYDGKLVMYSKKYMEQQTTDEPLYVGIDTDYRYSDRSGELFGECKIEQGKYKGSYKAHNGSDKVFIPSLDFTINSNKEADRYAKNMLRAANEGAYTGYLYSSILTGYAAGCMAKLENERAPSWDGDIFLMHVRNDYGKGLSKIFFRRPLEGGY